MLYRTLENIEHIKFDKCDSVKEHFKIFDGIQDTLIFNPKI